MTKFEDNISPYLSFVEGSAPSSPAATNFRLYYDSSDHLLKWKNSAGTVSTILASIPTQAVRYTAGNVTIGNTQSAHAAITATALDLTIAAATGDILAVSISRLHQNSGNGETFFDVASVVSAALTNYVSGGGGTGGIMGLYRTNNTPNFLAQAATILYTVVAGDISGGNVLLRPTSYNTGSSNGAVYAQANYPFHFSVANLKH